MNKKILTSVFAVCLAAAPAFATPAPATATNDSSDSSITLRAKMALLGAEGVHGTAVHVDTINGVVTLHGKVASSAERDRAAFAATVNGASSVRNLLQVVPAADKAFVADVDSAIKDKTSKLIKDDKSLAGSSISVKSVDKGVVILSGTAENDYDLLAAMELVSSTNGVRKVASEVKIKGVRTARARSVATENPNGRSTVTRGLGDAEIVTLIKLKLIGNSAVPALDVNVDSAAGNVTLFGIVPSAEAKQQAELSAKQVSGVVDVDNALQVVPESRRAMVDAKDADVQKDVKKELGRYTALSKVDVETKNGVVRLTGSIDSNDTRLTAATVARAVKGVRSVEDDLKQK